MRPRTHASKYRNVEIDLDGKRFDSKREAVRYGELKMLQSGGFVRNLETQFSFQLLGAGDKPLLYDNGREMRYIADFVYEEKQDDGSWEKVVEDVKGYRTTAYKIKRAIMRGMGIHIREVK